MHDNTTYSDNAVERARNEALEWLRNEDGYPRSWEQEKRNAAKRGYDHYDPAEVPFDIAPPIAGYEALERDGVATRVGVVNQDGQERIHFTLTPQPLSP